MELRGPWIKLNEGSIGLRGKQILFGSRCPNCNEYFRGKLVRQGPLQPVIADTPRSWILAKHLLPKLPNYSQRTPNLLMEQRKLMNRRKVRHQRGIGSPKGVGNRRQWAREGPGAR